MYDWVVECLCECFDEEDVYDEDGEDVEGLGEVVVWYVGFFLNCGCYWWFVGVGWVGWGVLVGGLLVVMWILLDM